MIHEMKHKNNSWCKLAARLHIRYVNGQMFLAIWDCLLTLHSFRKVRRRVMFETYYRLMLLSTYKMPKKASYCQGLKHKPYTEILLPIKSPEEGSSRRKHILYCVTLLDSAMLHFSLLGQLWKNSYQKDKTNCWK